MYNNEAKLRAVENMVSAGISGIVEEVLRGVAAAPEMDGINSSVIAAAVIAICVNHPIIGSCSSDPPMLAAIPHRRTARRKSRHNFGRHRCANRDNQLTISVSDRL